MKRTKLFGLTTTATYIISLLGIVPSVEAGTLAPVNFEAEIGAGYTTTPFTRTVTVDTVEDVTTTTTTTESKPNKLDVLFIADNTGSMQDAINNVKDNALDMLNTISAGYEDGDVQYGVARYYGDPQEYVTKTQQATGVKTVKYTITGKFKKSFKWYGIRFYKYKETHSGDDGSSFKKTKYFTSDKGKTYTEPSYTEDVTTYEWVVTGTNDTAAYQLQEGVDGGTKQDAIDAINNWSASGGADWAEGNFFALQQAATSGAATDSGHSTGYNTKWRPDAKKVIVWFGDAYSHTSTLGETETIAALNDNDVTVIAVHVNNWSLSYTQGLNLYNQASNIATNTSGTFSSVYTSDLASTIVQEVDEVITTTETTTVPGTTDLTFTSEGDTSGLTIVYTCTDAKGCTDVPGGESREFTIQVTGNQIGDYNFNTIVNGVSNAVGTNTIKVFPSD